MSHWKTKNLSKIKGLRSIILTLSLFTVFEITNREVIRISSIAAAIILLSVLSFKYNKKYTKGIKV